MGTGLPLTRADREWIEQRARAAGFDLAGVAAVPEPASAPASEDDRRYAQWIDAGYAGEMDYLKRADDAGEYLRGDLRRSMPWARSVIVCAVNYNAAAPKLDRSRRREGRMDRTICVERTGTIRRGQRLPRCTSAPASRAGVGAE